MQGAREALEALVAELKAKERQATEETASVMAEVEAAVARAKAAEEALATVRAAAAAAEAAFYAERAELRDALDGAVAAAAGASETTLQVGITFSPVRVWVKSLQSCAMRGCFPCCLSIARALVKLELTGDGVLCGANFNPQLHATHAEAEVAAAVARAEEAEERARLVEREANEERFRSAAEAAAEADRLRCELVAAQTKLATAHAEFLTVSDERDAAVEERRLLERSAVRAAESEAVEAELRDVCARLQVRV